VGKGAGLGLWLTSRIVKDKDKGRIRQKAAAFQLLQHSQGLQLGQKGPCIRL